MDDGGKLPLMAQTPPDEEIGDALRVARETLPKKEYKPFNVLPLREDEQGVHFDPYAGALGAVTRPFRYFKETMTGEKPMDVTSPEAIQSAADLGSAMTLGSGAFESPEGALRAGIKAYHGSPHLFPPTERNPLGEFDLSKMGSGEGAQAYGWGAYLAGLEDTARGYRDALSAKVNLGVPNQRLITSNISRKEREAVSNANQAFRQSLKSKGIEDFPFWRSFHDYYNFRNNIPELDEKYYSQNKEKIDAKIKSLEEKWSDPEQAKQMREILELGEDFMPSFEHIKSPYQSAYSAASSQIRGAAPGHMYEVEIAAEPHQLLDWDRPLSEQSEAVRKAVGRVNPDILRQKGPGLTSSEFQEKYGSILKNTPYEGMPEYVLNSILSSGPEGSKDFISLLGKSSPSAAKKLTSAVRQFNSPTGEQVYHSIGSSSGSTAGFLRAPDLGAEASNRFLAEGIPGLQYLDRGSRRAGEGTRNYVIFDPSIIDIKRRYADGGEVSGSVDLAQQDEDIQNALRIAKEPVRYDTGPQPGEPVLSSYDPTIKERIYQTVAGTEERPSPERAGFARGVSQMAEFAPFLGNVMAGQEAYRRGDTKGMLMAAVPLPGAAKEGAAVRGLENAVKTTPKSNIVEDALKLAKETPDAENALLATKTNKSLVDIPKDNIPPLPYNDTCVIYSLAHLTDKTPEEVWNAAHKYWKSGVGISPAMASHTVRKLGHEFHRDRVDLVYPNFAARPVTIKKLLERLKQEPEDKKFIIYTQFRGVPHAVSYAKGELKDVAGTHPNARVSMVSELKQIPRQERATGGKASGTMNDDIIQDALRIADSRLGRADGGEIPTPPRRPDDLEYYGVMGEAQKRFPFINKYDPHIKVEPREGDGDYAETYNETETGDPNNPSDARPAEFPYGSTGVRVYRPKEFTPADYAAEYLHVDPVANKTREELISRLTPEQLDFIKGQKDYQTSVERGLPEDRALNNVVDAMMRGYVMQDEPSHQWKKENLAELEFTPEELELLNSLQDYVEAPAEAIYNKKLFDNPEEN